MQEVSCCGAKASCCAVEAVDESAVVHENVREYYGKVLQKTADLQTNACCTSASLPKALKEILSSIHDEVIAKYYGCGLTIPTLLNGMHVLDLGSGSGRDCFVLSKLVGESGRVLGVDMTEEQISVATKHIEYHTKAFRYATSNVEFKKGYIEELSKLGIQSNSFDIIVSNCVINLSPNKEAVLKEAYRALKQGGELYFSDVYSDRRVPPHLVKHEVLYGECLSGALYWNDFLHLARKVGFKDPRLVSHSPISINNEEIETLIGNIKFYSATYRLFKLDDLEYDCEDYGQAVIYKGTIPDSPHSFVLDAHHNIPTGKVFPVCGNTYSMLKNTRFSPHFTFIGDTSTHYGIFDGCGKAIPFTSSGQEKDGGGCC